MDGGQWLWNTKTIYWLLSTNMFQWDKPTFSLRGTENFTTSRRDNNGIANINVYLTDHNSYESTIKLAIWKSTIYVLL